MKRQIKNSCKVVSKTILFTTLLLVAACKEKKEAVQTTIITQTKCDSCKVDTHVIVMAETESFKQNIPAGSSLNKEYPLDCSGLLISAYMFDKTEIASPLFIFLLKNVLLP